jgi:DNA-binding NarL/FixJ family response regulator/REP element-mobilizing transposase RayT
MLITVLMIHRQLAFAIAFKQALERAGAYQVHPFTAAGAALDYLRETPQDVLLLDFGVPDAADIVAAARMMQPGIAVIASPRQSDATITALNLQGVVDARFTARDIMALLHLLYPNADGSNTGKTKPLPTGDLPQLPPTRQARTANDASLDELVGRDPAPPRSVPPERPKRPLTARQEQFIEFILKDGMDAVLDELEQGGQDAPIQPENVPLPLRWVAPPLQPDELPETDKLDAAATPDETFARLAHDEPPAPSFEESGTVRDLVTGVSARSFSNVLSLLRGEEPAEGTETDDVQRYSDADLADAFDLTDEEPPLEAFTRPAESDDDPFAFGDESAEVDLSTTNRLSESQRNLERYLARLEAKLPETGGLERAEGKKPPSQKFPFEALPQFDDASGNTAQMVLNALDESTHLETFSVSQLLNSIESQLPANRPKLQVPPSWIAESDSHADIERYVMEPDFLPPTLPEAELIPEPPPTTLPEPLATERFSDQATRVSQGQRLEAETMDDVTEWLQPTSEVFPDAPWLEPTIDAAPSAPPPPPSIPDTAWDDAPIAGAGDTEPFAPIEDTPPARQSFALTEPITDPYIAQLALSLTQVSLELTAEAALLARYGRIVAYAGEMDRVDMDELRAAIGDDWEAQPRQARIRLITLEGSGKEYMLYSKLTDDDLTLSLIFAGTTPLRDIRRQGKQLIDALQAVPEYVPIPETYPPPVTPVLSEAPAPEDAPTRDAPLGIAARTDMPTEESLSPEERAALNAAIRGMDGDTVVTAYAMVWVLRDHAAILDSAAASAIASGMNIQLSERAWQIQDLQVKDDYVYVLAAVPGETPPYEIVRDLKRRAGEIAYRQNPALKPEALWGDGYLVVTPGRPLEIDEIQQFINFERM